MEGFVSEARSRGFMELSVPEGYDRFMARQLFEPWARELVARAGLEAGMSVLDVASGPGVVARLAAAAVGPDGRVVASDISPSMLAIAATKPEEPGSAPIEFRECSASALEAESSSFDRVLCQHGLQFFPDRERAVGEIHRVLVDGGLAAASTWAAEHPLGLFGEMAETLRECDLAEPYPRAFDVATYALAAPELVALFRGAGFRDVVVDTVELDCIWETIDDAVATVTGTPFAPIVAALPDEGKERVRTRLAERLGGVGDGAVCLQTASNLARGVK